MRTKHIIPQFGGYEFTISELDGGGTETKYYGYNIRGDRHHEAGGCYETIEGATRAVLARIETLSFDLKHV